MEQVIEISNESDIIPNKGIGEIKLGMNCFYLKKLISDNHSIKRMGTVAYSSSTDNGNWKFQIERPFFQNLNLFYKDFLSISINLFNGEVSYLTVNEKFKGKLFGKFQIGDNVRKFYKKAKKYNCLFCEFTDGAFFFWMEKRFGLLLKIGDYNIDCIDDNEFEQLLDMPITEITIFDDNQRIGIGENKYPEKWNM